MLPRRQEAQEEEEEEEENGKKQRQEEVERMPLPLSPPRAPAPRDDNNKPASRIGTHPRRAAETPELPERLK